MLKQKPKEQDQTASLFDKLDTPIDSRKPFHIFLQEKTAILHNDYWQSAVSLFLVEKRKDFHTEIAELETEMFEPNDLLALGFRIIIPARDVLWPDKQSKPIVIKWKRTASGKKVKREIIYIEGL